MRCRPAVTDDHALRLGAGLAGVVLTAGAVLAADLAREHMALVGAVCGAAAHAHCGWCYGAAALGLAGLSAFATAFTSPRLRRINLGPSDR